MRRRRISRVVVFAVAAAVVAAQVSSSRPNVAAASTGPTVERIFGPDAIGTAVAVSQRSYPQGGSASAVVLARSDFFADALTGGPLAAARAGPLLITPGPASSTSLDPRVLSEIRRVLQPGRTIYVLGGPLALDRSIDDVLKGYGYRPVRIFGPNQFATAVAIANALGNPTTIFEATGLGFADALSAVPAAIEQRGAILLTNGREQASETAAYLGAHPTTTRYSIGGPLAAAGADPGAIAVWGQDGFGTSAAVARYFFADATTFGAATGSDYPDALAGGVFMGMGAHLGPMLLVSQSVPIPAEIADFLNLHTSIVTGFLFGGPLAVGEDVVTAIEESGGRLPPAPGGVTAAPLDPFDAPDPFVLSVDPSYCAPLPALQGCYFAYTTQVYLLITPLWRSTDLVHWQLVSDAVVNGSAVHTVAPWVRYGRNWSPSVLIRPNNPPNSRYVMWYTAWQASTGNQCLGVATAPSPAGPFVDTSTGPAYCRDGGTIDASPFVDFDGTPYLVYASGFPGHLWVSQLTTDGRALVPGTEHLLWQGGIAPDAGVVEGPTLDRIGGQLYLFYSTDDWRTASYRVGVATCATVYGPCLRKYGTASLASRGSMLGPGGQSPFQDTAGVWHLMFHAWTSPFVGYPNGARSLHLLPLTFTTTDVRIG